MNKLASSQSSMDLISSFEKDPFIGHLSTPITNSNIVRAYLASLPIYQKNLSPLLSGINIGLVHAYFLFGPFFSLGPLRASEANAFIAFLSGTSLVIILTTALFIYGWASFANTKNDKSLHLFSLRGWQNFSSGFIVGGLSGASLAYLAVKVFQFQS